MSSKNDLREKVSLVKKILPLIFISSFFIIYLDLFLFCKTIMDVNLIRIDIEEVIED